MLLWGTVRIIKRPPLACTYVAYGATSAQGDGGFFCSFVTPGTTA